MEDLVVGAIAHYSWDKIEPWVVSLEHSGYRGKKAVIAYRLAPDLIERLIARGFYVKLVEHHTRSFNVDRYLFLWQLLHEMEARYVIATDTRDLVFQTNPSTWLQEHLSPSRLIVGSECLAHKDEPWSNQTTKLFWGSEVHAWMKEKTIYNSGSFAGEADAVRDLSLVIYLMNYHNLVPLATDQTAMNVLINLSPWKEITRLSSMADGWACQAGTVADPAKMNTFRPLLKEPEPVLGADSFIYPAGSSTPFCLVHQYERNPQWKPLILQRYRDETARSLSSAV
jgi:hypothetical protein